MFISSFIVLLSLSIVFSNKLQIKTTNKLDSCRTEGCCTHYENCRSLQVRDGHNFGCGVCDPEYLLTADNSGAGKCFKKNYIPHCELAQQEPQYFNNQPYCIVCHRNYAQKDLQSCVHVGPEQRTENCESYIFLKDRSIACFNCDNGYTLTTNYQCIKECDIKICSSCAVDETGQLGCMFCKDGYIGIYEGELSFYTSCINCQDWIKSLLTENCRQ